MHSESRLIFPVAVAAVASMSVASAQACSVFDERPCAPTVCSVFDPEPCMPQFDYPIGQDLRLTISSRAADNDSAHAPTGKLNTIAALFAALRACWQPPEKTKARAGLQLSVRLSFRRNGELVGPPRFTYATPGTPNADRNLYRDAVTAALNRCVPLPLTAGMAGALAGRPIAIRYVEDRL